MPYEKKLFCIFYTYIASLSKLPLSSFLLLYVVLQFFINNGSLKQWNAYVAVAVNETVAYS